jgi:hypothetical protein
MILIAQSMGSVNGREVHRTNPGRFGGFISTGGPNAGAMIANRVASGEWEPTANDIQDIGLGGFNSIVTPILNTFTGVMRFTPTGVILNALSQNFSWSTNYNSMYDRYVSRQIRSIPDATFGDNMTRNDLRVGSTKMVQLSNHNMDIPMIAIWGDERYPYFLRNASAKFDNQLRNWPTEIGVVRENLHDQAISVFRDFNGKIKRQADWLRFTNIVTGYFYNEVSKATKKSIDFFNGPFQTSLDAMAGNWVTETYSTRFWNQCSNGNPQETGLGGEQDFINDTGGDCQEGWVTYSYTVRTMEPNDGVVPKSSAIALPGVHPSCVIRAENVNHEEMKNHVEVARIFDRIFDARSNNRIVDDRDVGFFHLSPR